MTLEDDFNFCCPHCNKLIKLDISTNTKIIIYHILSKEKKVFQQNGILSYGDKPEVEIQTKEKKFKKEGLEYN